MRPGTPNEHHKWLFPVSVQTQGSLCPFGRAYGPKGVWGLKRVSQGVGGLGYEGFGLGYEGFRLRYEASGLGYGGLGLGYEGSGLGYEGLGGRAQD